MEINEIVAELRRRSTTKALPRCSQCGAFADRSSCMLGRKTTCPREKDLENGKSAPPIIMDQLLHEAMTTIEQLHAELLECRSLEPVHIDPIFAPRYMAFRLHANSMSRMRKKKPVFVAGKSKPKKRYSF